MHPGKIYLLIHHLPVFDIDAVHLLWHADGHEESVPRDAKRYKLLKAASTFPDKTKGSAQLISSNNGTVDY